jgi:carbon starvation protein CstA
MNTLYIVVIAAIVIYLAYNFYARRIDRDIIKSDAKRATPAKCMMVWIMPTSRNVLHGYHLNPLLPPGHRRTDHSRQPVGWAPAWYGS